MCAATSAEGYAGSCEAIAAMDLRPDLPRITAPTLAIAGEDDPATPPPYLRGDRRRACPTAGWSSYPTRPTSPPPSNRRPSPPAILEHLGVTR